MDWQSGLPRNGGPNRYRNDQDSGALISVTDSFHSLAATSLVVTSNTTGGVVSAASVYVQIIKTTIGAQTLVNLFFNWNLDVTGGANGDVLLTTVAGAGTPDPIPLVALPSINLGSGQHSTTATVMPVVGTLQTNETFTLQLYNVVGGGTNQRGQVSRSFIE